MTFSDNRVCNTYPLTIDNQISGFCFIEKIEFSVGE